MILIVKCEYNYYKKINFFLKLVFGVLVYFFMFIYKDIFDIFFYLFD